MSDSDGLDGLPTIHYDKPLDGRSVLTKKHYNSNTFIDWNSETHLVPDTSAFTYRKWLVIILTSICAGYVSTFIDLVAVWFNDFKKGLCFSKLDQWSLLNPYSTCPADDWYDWSQVLFNSKSVVGATFVTFPLYTLFGAVFTFIAIYLSQKAPLIQQSGIAEVKAIIQGFNYHLDSYLGVKTLLYKTTGLILVVSSGLWLGKEGPLVHVTCCILNLFFNMIFFDQNNNEAVRRELISAAAATGIALAFTSPIGGVLFVLEGLPTFFTPTKIMWNSFISSTLSVVVLVGFKIFTEGTNFDEKDMFAVEFGNFSWLFMELIPFVFLGLLGGYFGYFFIKLNSKFSSPGFRSRVQKRLCYLLHINIKYGNYVELMLLFLLTSVLNFPLKLTRLPLNSFLKLLFTDCPAENDSTEPNSASFLCQSSNVVNMLKLAYITIQAFFLSAYTFGTILPGGVLMPAFVIGACSGRLVGLISQSIQDSLGSLSTCSANSCLVSPSSYAVIGAGAFVTGITKLTMCVVVILFEMTGALPYVLPIMMSVMISKFASDYLCSHNIYDAWLMISFNTVDTKRGEMNEGKGTGICNYSITTSRAKNKLPETTVGNAMVPVNRTSCIYLFPETPYTQASLYSRLSDDNHEGYPFLVSSEVPISLGYIPKQTLYRVLTDMGSGTTTPISFQVANLDPDVLSRQIRYEQSLPEDFIKLDISLETPFIIVNEQTSLLLVVEIFEKLHLNYLMIYSATSQHSRTMSGFLDRFIVAKLIDSEFAELEEEMGVVDTYTSQFDIEEEPESTSFLPRREGNSIDLIT